MATDVTDGETAIPTGFNGLSDLLDQLISCLFVLNDANVLTPELIDTIATLAKDARLALDGELDPDLDLTTHAALREELGDLANDLFSEQALGQLSDQTIADLIPIIADAVNALPSELTPPDIERPIKPDQPRLPADIIEDAIRGNGDADTFTGLASADLAFGRGGNDTLRGRGGDDTLVGNAGRDLLTGGRGDDALFGGRQKDILRGGRGDDLLNGGRGDDTLYGASGDDTLTGGAGADVFVGFSRGGTDKITDFEQGVDQIDLSNTGLNFNDLSFSTLAGDTLITLGDGFLLVTGISNLSEDDFIF